MTRRACLLILTAGLLAGACAVGPDYRRPGTAAQGAFKEAGWQVAVPRDDFDRGQWWLIYHDEVLDGLEADVLAANQSLKAAAAQYRAAHALARQAVAGLWPTLDALATRTRSGQGSSATRPAAGALVLYNGELSSSWEIDLWGGLRRGAESARASAAASLADTAAARLSLQAEVASDYFALRTADATRALLDDTLAGYRRSLAITENQYRAGVAARGDVLQAQTQLKQTEAQSIDVDAQRALLEHALAVLVGKAPADFSLSPGTLPETVPEVPVGLPGELLERRPDVAAAERRVIAANAAIGVARAAYFPALSLAASGGYQSVTTQHWFSAPNRYWSLGPALAENLFDAGRRRAQSAQARAGYDAAVANYREIVLAGCQDVEDNLSLLHLLKLEAAAQDEAADLAHASLAVALNQYQAGTQSYLAVVTAQATALVNERSAVSLRGRRLAASVALVRALGGGFDAAHMAAPDTHP